MLEKNRMTYFYFDVVALLIIFSIVYCNYILFNWFSTRSAEGISSYIPYFTNIISAFLCSLLLQGEEILKIIRQRKLVCVRLELFILGSVIVLLVFLKFCYMILSPNNIIYATESQFNLVKASIAVFYGINIDIINMFVAGILIVFAFSLQSNTNIRTNGNRRSFFILYVILVILIVGIEYWNVWFLQSEFNKNNGFVYVLYFLNICKIFSYALILDTEKIIPIINNMKSVTISWYWIILSIIALLLAIIKIWVSLFFYDSHSPIFLAISSSSLWQIAYTFAAGILLVRAFNIKDDKIDFDDEM